MSDRPYGGWMIAGPLSNYHPIPGKQYRQAEWNQACADDVDGYDEDSLYAMFAWLGRFGTYATPMSSIEYAWHLMEHDN